MNARFGDLAGRGPIGQKQAKAKPDPRHLARVRELPCCICEAYGEPQLSPTAAHHVIHDRYSQTKTPDREAIPLCEGHHQGLRDQSKLAIHRAPDEWREKYGADHEWTAVTLDKLGF